MPSGSWLPRSSRSRVLFTLGALLLSNDVPVTYDVSAPAVILWGVLMLAAVVTWVVRRRQRR